MQVGAICDEPNNWLLKSWRNEPEYPLMYASSSKGWVSSTGTLDRFPTPLTV